MNGPQACGRIALQVPLVGGIGGRKGVSCVAVRGTGNASNNVSGEQACGGIGVGCVAISGTGYASNQVSGDGSCSVTGVHCIAVAPARDAAQVADLLP